MFRQVGRSIYAAMPSTTSHFGLVWKKGTIRNAGRGRGGGTERKGNLLYCTVYKEIIDNIGKVLYI
jgi:hypothetical protein